MTENLVEKLKETEYAERRLAQAKARLAQMKRKENAERRKAENKHKYMMGGVVHKYLPENAPREYTDWAIHDSVNEQGQRNLHFHCLLTLQPIEQDGTWGAKSRKVYILDEAGNKIRKLNDNSRKDDVVTFEQLGVDRLFVDESHNYKKVFLYTKMRNVAGIAQTEAQKSSDLYAKCRYLDEITGGKGVTFATGTPLSNSMTELYTNMRYLQQKAWRPSDIEQREGRIIRQGNQNDHVDIFRYVTEGTFDAYSWQLIENKQKFISQIMTSKSAVRSCEDIDEALLSYAEVKALATGNPYIKEKMDLDIQVSKLKLLKANHTSQIYRLQDDISVKFPAMIQNRKERIDGYEEDIAHYVSVKPAGEDVFAGMTINGQVFDEKKEAGTALIETCRNLKNPNETSQIGIYLGFSMGVHFDSFCKAFILSLKGAMTHNLELGLDTVGNITRIGNRFDAMSERLAETKEYRAERKPVRLSERISCMKEKAEAENEGRGVIAGKIKREEIG